MHGKFSPLFYFSGGVHGRPLLPRQRGNMPWSCRVKPCHAVGQQKFEEEREKKKEARGRGAQSFIFYRKGWAYDVTRRSLKL